MPGPLAGIRVVDFSAILSGAARHDDARRPGRRRDQGRAARPRRPDARSAPFAARRHRRVLRERQPRQALASRSTCARRGREIAARRSCARADVFVQNFRPGAVERTRHRRGGPARGAPGPRLRLDQRLRRERARTRHAASTTRSSRRSPGHVAIQKQSRRCRSRTSCATSSATRPRRTPRRRRSPPRSSRASAAPAASTCGVPMLDAALAFFWPDGMMAHTMVGDDVQPGPTLYEIYRLTETADGHLIYFAVSDSEIHGLFRALAGPSGARIPRFRRFERACRTRSCSARCSTTSSASGRRERSSRAWSPRAFPSGRCSRSRRCSTIRRCVHNERCSSASTRRAGRIRQPTPAARFDRTPHRFASLAPLHGEHTDEVLAELGYDADARRKLAADGIVVLPGDTSL